MEYYRSGKTKAAVCRKFGISRPTLDKWLKRWKLGRRLASLENRPPVPKKFRDILTAKEQVILRALSAQAAKPRLKGGRPNPSLLGILMRKPRRSGGVTSGADELTDPGEIDCFRTHYQGLSYREIQALLRSDGWVYGWDRRPPSLHAISNAINRRGHPFIRRKKT